MNSHASAGVPFAIINPSDATDTKPNTQRSNETCQMLHHHTRVRIVRFMSTRIVSAPLKRMNGSPHWVVCVCAFAPRRCHCPPAHCIPAPCHTVTGSRRLPALCRHKVPLSVDSNWCPMLANDSDIMTPHYGLPPLVHSRFFWEVRWACRCWRLDWQIKLSVYIFFDCISVTV